MPALVSGSSGAVCRRRTRRPLRPVRGNDEPRLNRYFADEATSQLQSGRCPWPGTFSPLGIATRKLASRLIFGHHRL